jgi:hypothetical protein
MKESVKPVAQRKAVGSSAERSGGAGSKGVAIQPPAYGIGIADRGVPATPKRENRTGLPDRLKEGVEALSRLSMDAVRVHYNSPKPAQLNALAYTQGTEIYVGPGQERHLGHEAWHVVQQAEGRVRSIRQIEGVGLNEEPRLELEAERMGAQAPQTSPTFTSIPGPILQTKVPVAQRVIENYQPGTLACTTRVMRHLNVQQMKVVQQLHDASSHHYRIDQARSIAIGLPMQTNPYEWEVVGVGNFAVANPSIQSILENFGRPTSSVVKTYDDLASRIGYEAGHNQAGALSASTVSDLKQVFDASGPLHMHLNPYLQTAWNENLAGYTGAKTGVPLYSVMRTAITGDFLAEPVGNMWLNDVLKRVSGRPFEIHHLLYKALYPTLSTNSANLMLAARSEKESVSGPGQHELMHRVTSGNHPDKFVTLLPQAIDVYNSWLKTATGAGLF